MPENRNRKISYSILKHKLCIKHQQWHEYQIGEICMPQEMADKLKQDMHKLLREISKLSIINGK